MSTTSTPWESLVSTREAAGVSRYRLAQDMGINCLLYTSPSPRDS